MICGRNQVRSERAEDVGCRVQAKREACLNDEPSLHHIRAPAMDLEVVRAMSVKVQKDLEQMRKAVHRELVAASASDISLGGYPISSDESMKFEKEYIYYAQGKSALNIINSTLNLLMIDRGSINNILDFPCGHGRVLRALRTGFPGAKIYACDLDRKGVDFCQDTFGAIPVYSSERLEEIELPRDMDLVWVGSLFTHLDQDIWLDFLNFFSSRLKEGGVLIFTFAGVFVKELVESGDHDFIDRSEAESALSDFRQNGFGFMQYNSARKKYGRTICSPLWVRSLISAECKDFRVVLDFERGWSGRQDVIVCTKNSLFARARS